MNAFGAAQKMYKNHIHNNASAYTKFVLNINQVILTDVCTKSKTREI